MMKNWNRRKFIGVAATTAVTLNLSAAPKTKGKAAIIGHTGAGNFGHRMDLVFNGLPNVEVVAVADPHDAGRAKAKANSKATRDYADYREMLAKEKPDLVAVAPRWSGEHHAMTMAALNVGAHVYLEKPFTMTLAEADEILQFAARKQRKIAVAHVTRMAPIVIRLQKALKEGLIGDVLEIHAVGKMGSRAGGQDMMVLGLHVFDIVRLFGGDVAWCHARIRQGGKAAKLSDAKESPSDRVGPVLGDDISAQFAMNTGINATFRSRRGLEKAAGPFGLEIIGSEGVIRFKSGVTPTISHLSGPSRIASSRSENWMTWTGGVSPADEAEVDGLTGYDAAHRRAVSDWLQAIEQYREPLASGQRAMKAIEMAHGVFQSGIEGRRIDFPLANRAHPLE
tara:strand:- start:6926 stop:8110 length:1185 start_codon:yes stop_codon:yes gene_type:complete